MASTERAVERAVEGRRERSKREKLERITAAARELFHSQGFEATTARQICERAEIGTGTLFLYVRDKRELLFLSFEADARRLFAQGRRAGARARGVVDELMALFGAFLTYYARDTALAKAILQELFFREHDPERMGRLHLEFAAHLSDVVVKAQARGELRSDLAPALAASACFAHYAYFVQGWLGAGLGSREQAEKGLRRALELQLEGLRAGAERNE
jgi:AcrR family transcriptional regulator